MNNPLGYEITIHMFLSNEERAEKAYEVVLFRHPHRATTLALAARMKSNDLSVDVAAIYATKKVKLKVPEYPPR